MKKELKFGLIGLGYFGKHYVRLLSSIFGVKLFGIANRSKGAFLRYKDIIPADVQTTTDADKLLSDPEIDCIIIATPASTHFQIASKALLAGKNVLLEKPMTATLKQAEDLAKLVSRSKKVFMVGHQYVYNDFVRRLKREIEKDSLGEIFWIFFQHFYLHPIRTDIGCFWESVAHELSIIDYLFSPRKITRVEGEVVFFNQKKYDDAAVLNIEFDKKLNAAITVSWFMPEKIRRLTILGKKGALLFDERKEDKLKLFPYRYPQKFSRRAYSYFFEEKKIRSKVFKLKAREPLKNELEHFIDCVRRGQEPATGIGHSLRIIKWMDETYRQL